VRHPTRPRRHLTIGHERLDQLVNLLRFLGLAPALGANDVCAHARASAWRGRTLPPDQAGFLGVLQVVAVRLGQAPVDRGLHPHDLVDQPGRFSKSKTKRCDKRV
jgi:hypothetical protein